MNNIMKNRFLTSIILSIVLLFAASLRIHTFYLPHNHGDQLFFLGLAMKLDNFGFKEYNLKGIDVVSDEKANILAVVNSGPGQKGSLLESLEKDNVFYYSNEPLSNMPPAFSYLLMLSHKIFSPNKVFLTVNRNLGSFGIIFRPRPFFVSQFYSVWINFTFSLLLILIVFLLGKSLFNEKAALWASFLMAIAPVDILTSQRLWTDEMASLFIALCVLLFWHGRTKRNLILFLLSGLSAGLAAITKQSGVFIIFVIIAFAVFVKYSETKTISRNLLFNKEIILFLAGVILICVFWYTKITLVYGAPWYMPYQKDIEKVASWFKYLSQRSRWGQLYYFVSLLPLTILFYFESFFTVLKRKFSPERILCLFWFFFFALFLILIPAKEERYMLPAYPAITIFSGIMLENLRTQLNKRKIYLGDSIIILILCLSAILSTKTALNCVFSNCAIFNSS